MGDERTWILYRYEQAEKTPGEWQVMNEHTPPLGSQFTAIEVVGASVLARLRLNSSEVCPNALVCQSCPCAGEDDVCFPGERLRAELEVLRSQLTEARALTNRWIRLFNRLDAAVSRWRNKPPPWADETDEALAAAHDRILKSAHEGLVPAPQDREPTT